MPANTTPQPEPFFPGTTLYGPAPRPATLPAPRVHTLDDDAYAQTQTDDEIRDGDVLVVPGVCVGVMVSAWPIAVTGDGESFGFHGLRPDADITCLGQTRWGRLFSYRYFPVDGPAEGLPAEEFLPPRGGADYSASFALAATVTL